MSTLIIGILVVLVILLIGYIVNNKRTKGTYKIFGNNNDPNSPKIIIIDRPDRGDILPFDGLPNGEIYDTVEQTSSAKHCAELCTADVNCDSFSYMTLDNVCKKRRNAHNETSAAYWIKGRKAMKVPGREIKADMLREQTVNNGEECAKVCLSDSTCGVADFNETTKTCRLGSVIASRDTVSGIIPSRRSAVDLASTS